MDNTDEKTEEQIALDMSDIISIPLKNAPDGSASAAEKAPAGGASEKSSAKEPLRGGEPSKKAETKPTEKFVEKPTEKTSDEGSRASAVASSDQPEKRSSPKDSANKIRSMLSGKKNESSASAEKASPKKENRTKHLSDMEVMEHTASIWQYKDIVDNGTEMRSEYHEKRTETELGKITAARVRGKKHKHEGTNCDDYFETAVTDDCIICVVCDGAGSKPLSRIGARVSAETAAGYLRETLSKEFRENAKLKAGLCEPLESGAFMSSCEKLAPVIQQSAREAFAAQQAELDVLRGDEKYRNALGREPVIGDMSTTFLAAVCVPLVIGEKRQTFMICIQIGDGCICAVDSGESSARCLKIMGLADSGAFSGETDFLSEKNTRPEVIAAKTRISRGNSDVIMLMTDGVADDYFPAEPMMKRLYLDLCMNGILPMKGELCAGEDPAPIRFKSVSLSQTSVALQYSKQLLSGNSDGGIDALWDKRDALRCHSLEAFRMDIGDTPQERLRVWLDNYNERGSFDDRTLAVMELKTGKV